MRGHNHRLLSRYETFVCGMLVGNKHDREEEKRQDEIKKKRRRN